MTAIPFDSHEFYSELVQSGLAEKTADALTKAVVKIEKAKLDELATKRDLKELEVKIAESKAELVRWVIGAGFLQVTLISGLILRLTDKI